jgi:hypothetical protein
VLALACPSCSTPERSWQRLALPDEFHVTYSQGETERANAGRTFRREGEALMVGMTWFLSAQQAAPGGLSRDDLMLLIEEIRRPQPAPPVDEASAPETQARTEIPEREFQEVSMAHEPSANAVQVAAVAREVAEVAHEVAEVAAVVATVAREVFEVAENVSVVAQQVVATSQDATLAAIDASVRGAEVLSTETIAPALPENSEPERLVPTEMPAEPAPPEAPLVEAQPVLEVAETDSRMTALVAAGGGAALLLALLCAPRTNRWVARMLGRS